MVVKNVCRAATGSLRCNGEGSSHLLAYVVAGNKNTPLMQCQKENMIKLLPFEWKVLTIGIHQAVCVLCAFASIAALVCKQQVCRYCLLPFEGGLEGRRRSCISRSTVLPE